MMDLSLAFFRRLLDRAPEGRGHPPVSGAMEYFRSSATGYDPHMHRTASGILRSAVSRYAAGFPGWRLSLMDSTPPCDPHSPAELAELFAGGTETPFTGLWEEELDPVLDQLRPREVLVSISYLSQLPAAVDLQRHLASRGIQPTVGGSLPRSLERSGEGLELLGNVFPGLTLDDGSAYTGSGDPLLSRLQWPLHAGRNPEYLTAHPVIPFTLSTGCWWDRCLFCPDRGRDHLTLASEVLEEFIASIPGSVMKRRPLIHFLDSAIPPAVLSDLPGILSGSGTSWFGFVRPTDHLLRPEGLMGRLAESGCAMLQTGVESGSGSILDRYRKGLDPSTALQVLRHSADAGIRNYAYLLLGLPGEAGTDRELTRLLVEEAGNSLDFLNISVFNLPRSSELSSRAEEFGIVPGDFDAPSHAVRLYRPFTERSGTDTRAEARTFIRQQLNTTPAASAALTRTPRWFRGSHMALMKLEGRADPWERMIQTPGGGGVISAAEDPSLPGGPGGPIVRTQEGGGRR